MSDTVYKFTDVARKHYLIVGPGGLSLGLIEDCEYEAFRVVSKGEAHDFATWIRNDHDMHVVPCREGMTPCEAWLTRDGELPLTGDNVVLMSYRAELLGVPYEVACAVDEWVSNEGER